MRSPSRAGILQIFSIQRILLKNRLGYCEPLHRTQYSSSKAIRSKTAASEDKRLKYMNGPGLSHFLANSQSLDNRYTKKLAEKVSHPYIKFEDVSGHQRKVYFDVYGCQMNVSDTEIAWSILKSHDFQRTERIEDADIILVVTCSIREGAEQKIWNKLDLYNGLKNKRMKKKNQTPLKIGVLGCMAERLKQQLLEKSRAVDLVVGPDSYRDLPRLLALTEHGQKAINVLLSLEETYGDIMPLSLSENRMSAFLSIMRGCDNMCTYCIVPHTRGRERSRSVESILEEVRFLSDQGIKEITLLGQNVNSYRDISEYSQSFTSQETTLAKGFKTIYKTKKGGLRFADLLDKVSQINPEIRIRFTSPHPKDFPDEVLYLIKERNNICSNIHLPAQSGNTRVLDLMRRGYSRDSYLELVSHIRDIIPGVSLSSDFICGFCSETEEEFQDTLSLIKEVRYNYCYLFPYSLREKTPAHRRFEDDVPSNVKLDRLDRMIKLFRQEALKLNQAQIGEKQLVLVEGHSKRSAKDFAGRNDGNTKVIFPDMETPVEGGNCLKNPTSGEYVEVQITEANSQVLKGYPIRIVTMDQFHS
ncbi:mitochondrial tRNA methylthiotransferase CDK5RAP1-like [Oratosquilla oratoria]|uniref:mitochondrial tRNA methylthiotransferase CDK5RAP1-like n=1 Tax=Oratosquilla oratoria TaxID=337810 RepID=UPI003F76B6B5